LIKTDTQTTLIIITIYTQQLYKQIKQIIIHYKYAIKIKVSKWIIQTINKIYLKIYVKHLASIVKNIKIQIITKEIQSLLDQAHRNEKYNIIIMM
jgi:hypothetical protein